MNLDRFWRGFLIGVLFGMLASVTILIVVAWLSVGIDLVYFGESVIGQW